MSYNSRPNGDGRPLPALRPDAPPPALANVEVESKIATAAKAIQIMNGRNDDGSFKIDEPLAIAAAVYQAGTGQILGRDFFINEKLGRIEGYQGVERNATQRGIGDIEYKFRRMTPEELEDNEVQPGDTAVICEISQLEVWRKKQLLGLPYSPVIGVGLIRENEKFTNTDQWEERTRRDGSKYSVKVGLKPRNEWRPIQLESGMTWHRKAKNRAYKDALRHTPGGYATGAEVIADAAIEVDGFELPPAGAVLTPEQANAWVEKQRAAEERRNRTPEQVAADQAAMQTQARKVALDAKWTDWLFAMEPCPYCGVPEGTKIECHGNGCEFRKLYPSAPKLSPAAPEQDCEEGQFRPVDEIPGETKQASPAEHIRARLVAEASGPEPFKRSKAPDRDARYAEGSLKVLIRDETQRQQVREWLMGDGDMTVGWAGALKGWINPTRITDPAAGDMWVPSDQSIADLRIIVEEQQFTPAQATLL